MFKNETVVAISVIALVLCCVAGASDTKDNHDSDRDRTRGPQLVLDGGGSRVECNDDEKVQKQANRLFDGDDKSNYRQFFDKFCSPAGKVVDCADAENDYRKDLKSFNTACGAAHADPSSQGNYLGCANDVLKCLYCMTPTGRKQHRKICGETSVDDSEADSKTVPGQKNLARARTTLKFCPSRLGEDQEKLEKEYDKVKANIDRLEAKSAELKRSASKLMKDTTKELNDLKKQNTKDTTQYNAKLKEARRSMEGVQKGITKQIEAMRLTIVQKGVESRQVVLKEGEAKVALSVQQSKVVMQCYAEAAQTVKRDQDIEFENRRLKITEIHSQNQLLKRYGTTDRQYWINQNKIYFDRCMGSGPIQLQLKPLYEAYRGAVEAKDAALLSIDKEVAEIRIQQLTLKSGHACGQPGVQEDESCQAARQAQEDIALLTQENYNSGLDRASEDSTIRSNGNAEAQKLTEDAFKNDTDLRAERDRFENLKKYMDLANDAAGSSDPKAYETLLEKWNFFKTSAENIVGACGKTNCDGTSNCANAWKFLNTALDYGLAKPDSFKGKNTPNDDRPPTTKAENTEH